METDIIVYDVVDSTNTIIEEMAGEGAAEGACVVAFAQTSGQGRSGRSFYSPPGGNLYMSFLLRPRNEDTGMLTVTAAVATVEAIRSVFDISTGIKWVNDIIYNDRKVCGIIARAQNYSTDDMYVTVGMGINIYESDDVPADIKGRYGTLTGEKCPLDKEKTRKQSLKLARTILDIFMGYYKNGFLNVMDKYRQNSVVIGRMVEYVQGESTKTAKVTGIDDDGSIMLDENGRISSYRDGEIRIRTADNLAL